MSNAKAQNRNLHCPIERFGLSTPTMHTSFYGCGDQYMWLPREAVTGGSYKEVHGKAADVLHKVIKGQDQTWPFWQYIQEKSDLLADMERAKKWAEPFDRIYVLGTGGSSLGAQVIRGLVSHYGKQQKELVFLDNVDPMPFHQLSVKGDVEKCGVLAISKSGTTPETLAQLGCMTAIWEKRLGNESLASHFLCLTEDKPSPMTKHCQQYNIACLKHDKSLGGRFSILSNVGMVPAALMGADVQAFQSGVFHVSTALNTVSDAPCVEFVTAHQVAYADYEITENVLMVYGDAWKGLPAWFAQLWGESLGKKGLGTTPIAAIGTQDQHSLLQLFLDGPKNKIYTFFVATDYGSPVALHTDDTSLSYLNGSSLSELFVAEAWATIRTLVEAGHFVRVVQFNRFDEKQLAIAMTNFMIETALQGVLWQIDAFDQPAVEQGKKLTKQFLSTN